MVVVTAGTMLTKVTIMTGTFVVIPITAGMVRLSLLTATMVAVAGGSIAML
jgi:hypothetical protein